MKVNNLEFEDCAFAWKLEKVNFKNLTLLVGASGVGKTQILKSIMRLKSITKGKSINGVKWKVEFISESKDTYIWEGEFENRGQLFEFDFFDDDSKKTKSKVLYEKIIKNNDILIERDSEKILFKNQETVKLSNTESSVHLLKEEELINPIFEEFNKVIFNDYTDSHREANRIYISDLQPKIKKFDDLEQLRDSDLNVRSKLYITYRKFPDYFEKILERYTDIFPQVEAIRVEPVEDKEGDLPIFFKDSPIIQIKEHGVENWIHQSNISSGMFRSLIHISEIYLCRQGTLFLIDEFENSLGINCINELTEDILAYRIEAQFILTSHHPYIINNIDYSNWKLVTRNKGIIRTHNPSEFNIGSSKHDSFMQLIQLEEYQTGKEA